MTPPPTYRWYPQAPAVPAHQPAPVYHTSINPLTGELVTLTAAEIEDRRLADRILYARWIHRQAELRERDRRTRRFWAGFGAVLGLGVLALFGVAGWYIYQAATSTGAGFAALGIAAALAVAAAALGHRCVTIVQHWH